MGPRELIGTATAGFGFLTAAAGVGNLAEQIGAVVLLIAGIATAWYGSKSKVNLATMRGNVDNAETATNTWRELAEGRLATVEQRDEQIKGLQVDKEQLRHELAKSRERIAALEGRPAFEDVTRQNEQHHQENLAHFQTLIELTRTLVATIAAGSTTVNVRPGDAAT